MRGDRLWATGQPRTPRRFMALAEPLAVRRVLAAQRVALLVVGRDVPLELRVGRREGVRAVAARLDDVVRVFPLRGARRGFEGARAGGADRRRRQALAQPGDE